MRSSLKAWGAAVSRNSWESFVLSRNEVEGKMMGRWHPNNCSPTEDRQEVIAAGSSQTQGSAFGREQQEDHMTWWPLYAEFPLLTGWCLGATLAMSFTEHAWVRSEIQTCWDPNIQIGCGVALPCWDVTHLCPGSPLSWWTCLPVFVLPSVTPFLTPGLNQAKKSSEFRPQRSRGHLFMIESSSHGFSASSRESLLAEESGHSVIWDSTVTGSWAPRLGALCLVWVEHHHLQRTVPCRDN